MKYAAVIEKGTEQLRGVRAGSSGLRGDWRNQGHLLTRCKENLTSCYASLTSWPLQAPLSSGTAAVHVTNRLRRGPPQEPSESSIRRHIPLDQDRPGCIRRLSSMAWTADDIESGGARSARRRRTSYRQRGISLAGPDTTAAVS